MGGFTYASYLNFKPVELSLGYYLSCYFYFYFYKFGISYFGGHSSLFNAHFLAIKIYLFV